MSDLIQPARGTKDLIGNVAREFDYIISKAMKVFETYGYEPIYTPIFEFTEVFKRTLGDYSDVVNKEMYNFEDRGGDSLTLRPEFTASIARSFISNGLTQNLPLKFYSHGPLFRYERPQKGRFRQFHQLNIEALGVSFPKIDGEIIEMAASLLKNFNILEKTELNINSLGCNDSRNAYQKALIEYFSKYISELSEDSKIRLQKNPLRILDSKNETDIKIAKESPKIDKYYTKESAKFFEDVLYYLDLVGVKYNINQKLVRGLDYYSQTAFEFITNDL
jgi:histidyl-tRNA synthetase